MKGKCLPRALFSFACGAILFYMASVYFAGSQIAVASIDGLAIEVKYIPARNVLGLAGVGGVMVQVSGDDLYFEGWISGRESFDFKDDIVSVEIVGASQYAKENRSPALGGADFFLELRKSDRSYRYYVRAVAERIRPGLDTTPAP